mmetsp:Transcript_5171/g.12103  ORF Transcript_5171/g.12103 Transcript_5171/m.12103 type:complete len:387 (-) Transcript_5171:221-1381(-)
MLRDITPIVFCTTANNWVEVPCAQTPNVSLTRKKQTGSDESLSMEHGMKQQNDFERISTLNILADCWPFFVELAICSKLRYEWLAREVRRLDATVLCLNEVSLSAIERIMADSFVRENYFVSEWGNSSTKESINRTIGKHGCFILSKVPFESLSAFEWSTPATQSNREVIVARVNLCGISTVLCATHSSHRQKQHQKREQQITELKQAVEADAKYGDAKAFFILGDLNVYSNSEDGMIVRNGMLDLWAETHFTGTAPFNDLDPGFTFDSQTNLMIPRYVPGHTRRMRLDRILMREHSLLRPHSKCTIWANESVDPQHPEVFPSDHYGLSIEVARATAPTVGDPAAAAVLAQNASEEPERHRRSLYANTVSIGLHCGWLLGRAVGVV